MGDSHRMNLPKEKKKKLSRSLTHLKVFHIPHGLQERVQSLGGNAAPNPPFRSRLAIRKRPLLPHWLPYLFPGGTDHARFSSVSPAPIAVPGTQQLLSKCLLIRQRGRVQACALPLTPGKAPPQPSGESPGLSKGSLNTSRARCPLRLASPPAADHFRPLLLFKHLLLLRLVRATDPGVSGGRQGFWEAMRSSGKVTSLWPGGPSHPSRGTLHK